MTTMFTGIIQKLGLIERMEKAADSSIFYLTAKDNFFSGIKKGASVAVNGVCLTVEENANQVVRLTAVKQTMDTTALGDLQEEDPINLELPCTPESFLGGHIMMGHVDGVAEVTRIEELETGQEVWFKIPAGFHKYIISKGSIALDGVSMTVAEKTAEGLKVAVIPETVGNTRFGVYKIGSRVNFEVDVIGKYVENFIIKSNE